MRISSRNCGAINQCEVECKSYKIVLYSQERKTISVLIEDTNLKK